MCGPCLEASRLHDVMRQKKTTVWLPEALAEQAEVAAGGGPDGALSTPEKEELRRLRRECNQLRMERDILKAATAFFAKESK